MKKSEKYPPIPQFQKNKRFVKTMSSIAVFSVFVGAIIWTYSLQVSKDLDESKLSVLRAAISLYHKEHSTYPTSLSELVEAQYINKIPLKDDKSSFRYTPIKNNNNIVDFSLK